MKRTTRTEIRVETYEFLAVRRHASSAQGWCEHCGKRVGMIGLVEITRAGLSQDAVYRKADAGNLHFIDATQSPPFICLNSLVDCV